MTSERRHTIASRLRHQLLRALDAGTLHEGARLPSARQLATELGTNPRTVAAAYRTLVADGIVEIRARSGAFVARSPSGRPDNAPAPADWVRDVLLDGVARGIPTAVLPDLLRRATDAGDINVVVLANIVDQIDGLARELREYFGVRARGIVLDSLRPGERLPRALQRAHLLVTTQGNADEVNRIAARLDKPHIIACVRDDLMSSEWRQLLAQDAYIVVADPRFGEVAHEFVRRTADASKLRVLVAGRDPLNIPPGAPTYVTESARTRLGLAHLPGRLVAPVRILTTECAKDILTFILSRTLRTGPKSKRVSRR